MFDLNGSHARVSSRKTAYLHEPITGDRDNVQHLKRSHLIFGEYALRDQNEDSQTAVARSLFVEASKLVVPEFLLELRTTVYPVFARAAGGNQDYYRYGWPFRTWALLSDRAGNVQASLSRWARQFNAEEEWVLQGALSTLRQWQLDPEWRDELGTTGFHLPVAGEDFVFCVEHRLQFFYLGWGPPRLILAALWGQIFLG